MIVAQAAIGVAAETCHAGWLICAMDAHEGTGTWFAGVATFAAVVVALLTPILMERAEYQRRKRAFFSFIGHAHALVRMYFNTNDQASENATVETGATRTLLKSAIQATEDAIHLQYLGGELMIGALNLRTSLNFMLLDLDRISGTASAVLVGELKRGYAPLRKDIDEWRQRLKTLGADVGSDTDSGADPHILRT